MPDLRTWLSDVDNLGQLMTVENVHWDLELSTLTEIINERSKTRPAILFDSIKDYPQGYRVAANLVSSTGRLALTLGMDSGLSDIEFIQSWRRQVKKISPLAAETVPTAPLFENVQKGKDIDVLKFPVPRWHELDGGRYIGTAVWSITRDPEEDWVNVGTYRVMVHGRTAWRCTSRRASTAASIATNTSRGKPLPVAMSFGHHPLIFLVASTDVPYRVNEYDWAGGILGEPLTVVARAAHRPTDSRRCRDRRRGRVGARRRHARRAVRRVDRLLRQRSEGRAGDPRRGDLFPQQSDHPRLPAVQAPERRQPAFLADALGADLERDRRSRRARRARRVVPPVRRPLLDRACDQAALPRPRAPGGTIAASAALAPTSAATWSSWTTTSTSPTEESSGRCARAPTPSSRSTSSSAPGAARSTRDPAPAKKASTRARSSTPPAPTSGAKDFPRSVAPAANSRIKSRAIGAAFSMRLSRR